MPFKAPPVQPDFSLLEKTLASSGNQQTDNALYQTLFILFKKLVQMQGLFVDSDNEINLDLSAIKAATVLTVNDETNTFANSRRLLAGTGISFDDTVANIRTISSSNTSDYVIATTGAEPAEILSDGFGSAIHILFSPP
jgi:hypothetical protein